MAEIVPPKRSGKGLPPPISKTAGTLGMSMLELLQEGFRLVKEKKGYTH